MSGDVIVKASCTSAGQRCQAIAPREPDGETGALCLLQRTPPKWQISARIGIVDFVRRGQASRRACLSGQLCRRLATDPSIAFAIGATSCERTLAAWARRTLTHLQSVLRLREIGLPGNTVVTRNVRRSDGPILFGGSSCRGCRAMGQQNVCFERRQLQRRRDGTSPEFFLRPSSSRHCTAADGPLSDARSRRRRERLDARSGHRVSDFAALACPGARATPQHGTDASDIAAAPASASGAAGGGGGAGAPARTVNAPVSGDGDGTRRFLSAASSSCFCLPPPHLDRERDTNNADLDLGNLHVLLGHEQGTPPKCPSCRRREGRGMMDVPGDCGRSMHVHASALRSWHRRRMQIACLGTIGTTMFSFGGLVVTSDLPGSTCTWVAARQTRAAGVTSAW